MTYSLDFVASCMNLTHTLTQINRKRSGYGFLVYRIPFVGANKSKAHSASLTIPLKLYELLLQFMIFFLLFVFYASFSVMLSFIDFVSCLCVFMCLYVCKTHIYYERARDAHTCMRTSWLLHWHAVPNDREITVNLHMAYLTKNILTIYRFYWHFGICWSHTSHALTSIFNTDGLMIKKVLCICLKKDNAYIQMLVGWDKRRKRKARR